MKPDETFEAPFDTDEETAETSNTDDAGAVADADADAAQKAWDDDAKDVEPVDEQQESELAELAQPYVGQWNKLISTTNWEKGRIISQWREALIESGVDSHQFSDDAWARRVGGVTAPHVGRLRRVHDRFASTYETYDGLYWSHFLAALDWDDAPMWLEGASQENWSVAGMRERRWEAQGAVESQRPGSGEIIEVDVDEDVVMPAQGGGRTKEYGDEPGVASGPLHEEPDFGEEEELMPMSAGAEAAAAPSDSNEQPQVQPFAGLPELPDDLADAIEDLKLCVLRHKTSGWADTDAATVKRYLDAISVLLTS